MIADLPDSSCINIPELAGMYQLTRRAPAESNHKSASSFWGIEANLFDFALPWDR